MVDVALSLEVDASGAVRGYKSYNDGADTTIRKSEQVNTVTKKVSSSFDQLRQSIFSLKGAFGGLAAAFSVSEIIKAADTYSLLRARINLVTESQQQSAQVYAKLLTVANQNRASLESTIGLYTRLAQSTKQYGASQTQVISLTDAVSKTFLISGASAAEAAAGALQFGQALGSGKLAGDEFKSITENNIRLTKALADAFGTSTGKLKDMSEKGLLTTEEILKRLPKAYEQIAKEAATLPVTVGGAFTVLKNNFLDYIGGANDATGATSVLAKAILGLADFVKNSGRYFDEFSLASTVAIGGLLKFGNSVHTVLQAIGEGFRGAFSYVKEILVAFGADIAEFVKNPFGNGGFDKLGAALSKGFGDAFSDAYKKRMKEGLEFNKAIDEQIENKSLALAKKYQKSQDEITESQKNQKKAIEAVSKEQERLNKIRAKAISDAGLEASQAERLNQSNQISIGHYEIMKDQIDRENKLRAVGLDLKSEQGRKLDEEIKKTQESNKAIEVQNALREDSVKIAEEMTKADEERRKQLLEASAQPFIDAAKNIQNSLAENIATGITNGFAKGRNPLEQFGKILRQTMIQALSQSIAAGLAKALINPAISGFASSISPLLGGAVSKSLGVGQSGIPFAGGAAIASAGKLLGGSIIGAGAGSIVAGAAGGNAIGGSLGGAAGGYAGGLAGQALIPIPGVGFVIGSALGGALGGGLGGLFGAGKGVSAAEFSGNVSGTGLGGLSFGSKKGDLGQVKGVAETLGNILSSLVSDGVKVANDNIRGAINSKSGNRFEILGKDGSVSKSFGFDPKDAESVNSAVAALAVELAKTGNNSGKLAEVLKTIQTEGRKAEDILNEISIAANFEKVRDAFNKNIGDQILQITDPKKYDFEQLDSRFDELRKNATDVGGDLVAIEKLYGLERQKVVEKYANDNVAILGITTKDFEELLKSTANSSLNIAQQQATALEQTEARFRQFASSISSFRTSLLLNKSLSPLSPQQRLDESKRQFESVAALAQLGNEDAISKLQSVSEAYLQESKSYYASSEAYFSDFNRVQEVLKATEEVAARQANIALDQLSISRKQVDLLQQLVSKTGAKVQDFGARPELNKALAAATGYTGDFGPNNNTFLRLVEAGAYTKEQTDTVRNLLVGAGDIPHFASGGDFSGGYMIAGEPGKRGGELIATGKARVHNASQTRQIFAPTANENLGGRLDTLISLTSSRMKQSAAETTALKEEIAALKEDNKKMASQMSRLLSRPA